ncbi:STAS domain-containing protein [Streptomyces luteogriseus]|uniref:Uncharacterized protein n=1 Tax=Streptomyces luteogriseus TaxID=68233 RepID=A0A7W7DVL4_9ACTN|nr:hypothetical protein [Streptomyces luteogriseus]MBB4717758.1 hypothetical protein [Streptomyces luteogriseus]
MVHEALLGEGEAVPARVVGARQAVRRVLQVTGVDTLIPCHPTVQQALTA